MLDVAAEADNEAQLGRSDHGVRRHCSIDESGTAHEAHQGRRTTVKQQRTSP